MRTIVEFPNKTVGEFDYVFMESGGPSAVGVWSPKKDETTFFLTSPKVPYIIRKGNTCYIGEHMVKHYHYENLMAVPTYRN